MFCLAAENPLFLNAATVFAAEDALVYGDISEKNYVYSTPRGIYYPTFPVNGYFQPESIDEAVVEGSYRLSFGVEDKDLIWKDANYSLQESGWRYFYGEDRYNTFDPAIYNQLRLGLISPIDEDELIYTKLSIDPWAFTGTTQTVTLPTYYAGTNAGDPLTIQLKYLSNNRRTYPEIVYSAAGDAFALPEIKIVDGKTQPVTVEGSWQSGTPWVHRVEIPALDVEREFNPIRALWYDARKPDYRLIVFPFAEAQMGLTSDDPLRLVNNHIIWEPSPWLSEWEPGRLFTATGWQEGQWQEDQFLRMSDGTWLTLLRGFRVDGQIGETYGSFMAATPLDPWQDYETVNNVPLAFRLKRPLDGATVGLTYAGRVGFDQGSYDALDQTAGLDADIGFLDFFRLQLQGAFSRNKRNITTEDREQESDDTAVRAIFSADVDPFELPLGISVSYASMGLDFASPLSNYANTADDQEWGKHIHFFPRAPEEEQYRIGDSIEPDRRVTGVSLSAGDFEGMSFYFNLRNVYNETSDEFIEDIYWLENEYKVNDSLRTKLLLRYHDKVEAGDGVNRNEATYAFGFRYDFTDWLGLEQIFERTNDYPDFPGSVYSWMNINPAAPYPYFYIYKTSLIFSPTDWSRLILSHSYNEFDYAATAEDFMNYTGVNLHLRFSEKLLSHIIYRHSEVADYLQGGEVIGHDNFYCDLSYSITEDSRLMLQFGALGNYIPGLGWQSAVLDTQHIFRLVYQGSF